jgi:hypothetical protein
VTRVPASPEDKERARTLYRSMGARQVAAEMRVSERTVRRWLDGELRPPGRVPAVPQVRQVRQNFGLPPELAPAPGDREWLESRAAAEGKTAADLEAEAIAALRYARKRGDPARAAFPRADRGTTAMRLGDLPRTLLVMSEPDWRTACLVWRGKTDGEGYGHLGPGRVHRVAWEIIVGPIGEGMTLDHLRRRGCRYRACWAPWHLEEVTAEENMRRTGLPRGYRHSRPRRQQPGLPPA